MVDTSTTMFAPQPIGAPGTFSLSSYDPYQYSNMFQIEAQNQAAANARNNAAVAQGNWQAANTHFTNAFSPSGEGGIFSAPAPNFGAMPSMGDFGATGMALPSLGGYGDFGATGMPLPSMPSASDFGATGMALPSMPYLSDFYSGGSSQTSPSGWGIGSAQASEVPSWGGATSASGQWGSMPSASDFGATGMPLPGMEGDFSSPAGGNYNPSIGGMQFRMPGVVDTPAGASNWDPQGVGYGIASIFGASDPSWISKNWGGAQAGEVPSWGGATSANGVLGAPNAGLETAIAPSSPSWTGTGGYPSVANIFGQLESSNGNPTSIARNVSYGLADPYYGQQAGWINQFGKGAAGINNFAGQVLGANPSATVGDLYANYAGGFSPTSHTFPWLQSVEPSYAHNFNTNSPVPANTPINAYDPFVAPVLPTNMLGWGGR